MKAVFSFLVVNLFLLLVILAGSGAYLVLGFYVGQYAGDDNGILYFLAAINSVIFAYYFSKYLYQVVDRYLVNPRKS